VPLPTTPRNYEAKLTGFAAEQADTHGIAVEAMRVVGTDPAAEINKLVLKAVKDTGADLVVIVSHPPRMLDWILLSHGGHVAEHLEVSVFVIR
jgi:nucleotide-binding universal stress UspA family protein